MRILFRGALSGAAFALVVAAVEMALSARLLIANRFAVDVSVSATTAGLEIGLGALLGIALAPLLRPRGGRFWHLLGVGLAFTGLELYAAPESPTFRQFVLVGPGAAFVAVLFGRLLARRWRWLPGPIACAALAGAIAAPTLYIRFTTPAPVPRAELPPAPAGAPDVVIVVLDTVRADHVSAYGYAKRTTPNLEALAREGTLFLDASAPSTWSLPSHASLFTGLYPSGHGAHAEHRFLDREAPTLGDVLSEAGYDTRCFTANAWISDGLGLTRGFAWCDEAWRDGRAGRGFVFVYRLLDRLGFGVDDKGGGKVASNFEGWTASRPADARPTFVFLNFLEAHFPHHQLPDEFLASFTSLPRGQLRPISLQLLATQTSRRCASPPRPCTTRASSTPITCWGASSRRSGGGDRWIAPSSSCSPITARCSASTASSDTASRCTNRSRECRLCSATRLGFRRGCESSRVGSLLPAIDTGIGGGPVLIERFEARINVGGRSEPMLRPDTRYRAYRSGSRKLVETSRGTTYLFDVVADPGERSDLAPDSGPELAQLKTELEARRSRLGLPALDAPVMRGQAPELPDATRERLRALGYVE
jgi:hypothetical protein